MAKKKKKRVLKIKNICIFLGTLILLGLLIYYIVTMPIKNIYVNGEKYITENEILELTSLYEYPSFLLTKKTTLINKIKKNNYIKNVTIRKKWGSILEINIEEYTPLALTKDNKIIIENGHLLDNIYNETDIPLLINEITDKEIYNNLSKKLKKINKNILRQISQIEYSPVEVDKDRFLLYMSDKNKVYITLTKIEKMNKYNKIKDALEGNSGIIYLDSGNYAELN